ncbi:hypothetical protein D2917_07950 [Cupriavidus oxalaticus]|uniref:Integrase catalytic domain-containing protein n=2 Tax=Cupriavidus oxalaticus TaxID=96344 RepID=A0A5P3VD47_9BURK|nr:hypothetical protein D2917_07950 [Cupriavidus oxalaticus]
MDLPLPKLNRSKPLPLDRKGKPVKDPYAIAVKRHEWVDLLLVEGMSRYLSDEGYRVSRLAEVAKLTGVSKVRLMQVLTRYFWYGGGIGSVYAVTWEQGGRGQGRLETNIEKVGRPNANVTFDPETKWRGANMCPDLLKKWLKLVETHYPLGMEISKIFDELMAPTLVVIPAHKRQEKRLFVEYGYRAINDLDLKRKRVGHIDWLQKHGARVGSATDLCGDAIDIYDLDGTEFNCYLKYGGERQEGIGKPIVIFAVSRRSRAVVGWFVCLEPESGKTYKHCLFSAFTSKARVLSRLGIKEKLKGLVYGMCQQVFFDRGPGISESVRVAVVNGLEIDQAFAEPFRGDLKGLVEGIHRIFQERFASLHGGYRRTNNRADNEKQAHAEEAAVLTLEEFEKILVYAINHYNLTGDITKVWINDMLQEKFELNPAGIFNWYRERRYDGAASDWTDAEIYLRLLEVKELTVRKGAVRLDGGRYSSAELKTYFDKRKQRARDPGNFTIPVRVPMDDGSYLLWEREDGTFTELCETKETHRRYGRVMRVGRKFINLWLRAKRRVTLALGKSGEQLSKAREEVLAEATERQSAATETGGTKKQARAEKAAEHKAARAKEQRDVLGLPPSASQDEGYRDGREDGLPMAPSRVGRSPLDATLEMLRAGLGQLRVVAPKAISKSSEGAPTE